MVGLVAILALTLPPNPRGSIVADYTPLHCLVCGEGGGADVALNLLLFLPLAIGLTLLEWPWVRVVGTCALLSLGVEAFQYFSDQGRDASLSDLLTNTTSGALGAALAARLGVILWPAAETARRLSLAAAGAWLALLAFTAVSLRPWIPPGRLRNYCTPSYPTGHEFAGTSRSMTLDGVALACDEDVPQSAGLQEQLHDGQMRLETVAETGERRQGPKVIHLVRGSTSTLVILTQFGRAAEFRASTASQALALFGPTVRLARAFPEEPGALVELVAEAGGRVLRLSAVHDGGRREVELAISPSFGWTFLFPASIEPGLRLRLTTALWLAALILPAAYWAGRSVRPMGAYGTLGGAVIAGLGLVPAVTGFRPVHWSEWAGAAAGIVLGWALTRIAAYIQSRCGSPSISAYSSS